MHEINTSRTNIRSRLLEEDVTDWSMMTNRVALVKRSRGVFGVFDVPLKVVIGDSKLGCKELSALKCE
jgi:hypothetical protein